MGGGIYAKKPLLPQQPPVRLSPEEQVLGTPSAGLWDPPSFCLHKRATQVLKIK